MNNLSWQIFKNTLLENPNKELRFRYSENDFIDPSYHITEIKQVSVVSVDCGGKMNSWTEIVVQLWEPNISKAGRGMQVKKALSIIDVVDRSLPLNPNAVVKIEFGNSKFDTRQMFPSAFLVEGDIFTVNLAPEVTQCKALGRGETCGTNSDRSTPIAAETVGQVACCTPGGGCC